MGRNEKIEVDKKKMANQNVLIGVMCIEASIDICSRATKPLYCVLYYNSRPTSGVFDTTGVASINGTVH